MKKKDIDDIYIYIVSIDQYKQCAKSAQYRSRAI